jgi:hypothetical protein
MKSKKSTKKTNQLAKFTDEELYAELARRATDNRLLRYKGTNKNGFTPKDVVCIQGCEQDYQEEQRGYKDPYGPNYSFYLRVDGKLFDIYYKNCVTGDYDAREDVEPSKWPWHGDGPEDVYNGAADEFVPDDFVEAAENMYEYHGKKPVEKYLKECGIEFRVWNPALNNKETGDDKNYA